MNPLPRSRRSDWSHAAFTLTLAARLLAALLLFMASAMAQENRPGGKKAQEFALVAGKSVEQEIAGGETHSYSVTLQPGQFLRALVTPHGVNVVAVLSGPGGEKLLTVDLFKRPGPEPVSFVAEKAGAYRLEVRADAPATLRGRYELTSEVKAAASVADRERLSAERLLAEADTLWRQELKESWQRSIEKSSESLALWRKLGDKYWEAHALHLSGVAYFLLGEKQKALNFYNQALALRREIEDKRGEAYSLYNIGITYIHLGEKQKALEAYHQVLPIYRAVGDKNGEADTLYAIGAVYYELGEKQKALEFYRQSLPLKRAVGDKPGEADTLYAVGFVYSELGEKQKALEFFNQALPLKRAIGDKSGEADTLNSIGLIYSDLGEKQKALEFYNQSLPLKRAVGDKRIEANTLYAIGAVYYALGDRRKALEFYHQALPLKRAVGDKSGEADTLYAIGFAYSDLGESQKALEFYNQALPLKRAVGDKRGEAETLNNIGIVYNTLGENQKALEFYNQALPLSRAVGDKSGEANTLINIGVIYGSVGEQQKALEFFNRALPLKRAVGDKSGEAATLNNIGLIYSALGEQQKALEFFNQSLLLRRAAGDKSNEGLMLNNIGTVYYLLGEKQKALEFYNQALPLRRLVGDKRGEASTLQNIGLVYNDLGEHQKALEFYNQALLLSRAVGDKGGEANRLNNIGLAYSDLGEYQKALEFYNQALPLSRAVGDKSGEADLLINIGVVYGSRDEQQKALEFFNQALPLKRAVDDKGGEAITLGNLMSMWNKMDKPALAIFYGKQAVNAYQQLRGNIQGLDKEIQKTYLQTVEKQYRRLADLLISADRLPEAQQVLALLKEEEYFEFVRRDPNTSPVTARATLTADEAKLEEEYRKLADQVTLLGRQRGELFDKKERTDEEDRLLARLDERLSVASDHFQKFLEQLQVRLNPNTAKGARVVEVKDALGMKKTLRELGPGTVLLYTLVGADKYRVMLVTPDSEQAYENATGAVALQRKVLAFREALQDPHGNPAPLAKELYGILVGPKLAHDLEQAGAKTLMWSLDGVLRYLPIAALHDGRKYLVESYRNVIFTPASRDRLKDPVSPHWKALGLGVSQSRQIELNGQKLAFKPLPGVPKELRSIIRDTSSAQAGNGGDGVLTGRVILDQSFTKDAMKTALRQRYQLVHIASHFVFQPGNETSSFLLLGDSDPRNDRLTLEEVKKVRFEGVDLLTLSACETALGGKQANGVEVESFGVLAQRQGATAVMATLWPVADESTSQLMREFYRIREGNSGITKAEALQRAQLMLLRDTVQSQGGAAKDKHTNWRHPYYWAPFILIGNWR